LVPSTGKEETVTLTLKEMCEKVEGFQPLSPGGETKKEWLKKGKVGEKTGEDKGTRLEM